MADSRSSVISEVVYVPMRDGTQLSVHIHRPDAGHSIPAIVNCTPYRKAPLRTGSHHPIVKHGYATVTFDIRGTGNSGGWNESIYSEEERKDIYEMIEWCAARPWCNGNVGMWGISFGAVAALQAAMAAPPHLKAIIARSGSDDPYTEWTNPGGSPNVYIYGCYAPIMAAANFSPPDPEETGERWADMWQERLDKSVPWGLSFLRNINDGPFWRERSLRDRYDQVKCAVFVVGGWADWYYTPLLRIFSRLKVPKRALIGPWSHDMPDSAIPGPRIDWLRESLKWFDHWLKDIDTGVMNEPPLTIFVREGRKPANIVAKEAGGFRCENEWPPARTIETPLFLEEGGRLCPTPPESAEPVRNKIDSDPGVGMTTGMHGGGPFTVNWVMPLDQREDELHCLTYTGDPLSEETEITGQARVVLHLSCSAKVGLLSLKLCDVAANGVSSLVAKGFLNLTHRDSHITPSFMEPGKIYEIQVKLLACAYRFAKGHRIRLTIGAADALNLWPTPEPCSHTIHIGPDYPSRIELPVIPVQDPELPPPDLRPSPRTDIDPGRLDTPEFTIGRDIINNKISVRYNQRLSDRWTNSSDMEIDGDNPASTVIKGESSYSTNCSGKNIVVSTKSVTSSDSQAFHQTTDVEITVDKTRHFQKSWVISVPRGFA